MTQNKKQQRRAITYSQFSEIYWKKRTTTARIFTKWHRKTY